VRGKIRRKWDTNAGFSQVPELPTKEEVEDQIIGSWRGRSSKVLSSGRDKGKERTGGFVLLVGGGGGGCGGLGGGTAEKHQGQGKKKPPKREKKELVFSKEKGSVRLGSFVLKLLGPI